MAINNVPGAAADNYYTATATAGTTAATMTTYSWDVPSYTTAARTDTGTYTVERPDIVVGPDTTGYEGDMTSAIAGNSFSATSGYTDVNTYSFGDVIPTTAAIRTGEDIVADPKMTATNVGGTYDATSGYTLGNNEFNTVATGAVQYAAPVDERGRSLYDLQRQQVVADAEK